MSEKRKDNKGRVLKTGESQRKDGRYQYRYVTLGNQRRTVYAPTLAELREKEARISEMQKAGVDYQESLIDVKTLLQRYIDLKLFAKVNTLKRYTYTLRKISRYPISDMPISRCTKSDVKKLLITWQSEGLCYETILHYLSFMEQAFQVAVDDGILKVNPCKFDLRDVIPEQQKPVKTLPSEQQLASWLGYVYGNKVYRNKYDIYVVLLYTGLRVSELTKLNAEDIRRGYKDVYSKGNRIRRIYLPHRLALEMNAWLNSIGRLQGPVFLNRFGKPISAGGIRFQLRAFAIRYGLDPELVHPHAFRHLFARNFIDKSGDLSLLADLLGQENIETTRIYLQRSHLEQQQIIDRVIQW